MFSGIQEKYTSLILFQVTTKILIIYLPLTVLNSRAKTDLKNYLFNSLIVLWVVFHNTGPKVHKTTGSFWHYFKFFSHFHYSLDMT